MSTLGALSAAWTAAEAARLLVWRTVGVMRREQALRLLPALSDEPRPDWCALAEDEAGRIGASGAARRMQPATTMADGFFENFAIDWMDVGEAQLRVRHGGSGFPVLLLHGHPRTHTTWHRVAPLLAEEFTVVCPDLRGYGESTVPPDRPDHAQMGKRAMAADGVAVMSALGHSRFAVAGHDRGLYVAARMALDAPTHVTHLVVMDGVPIGEALRRADARFATAWWHWFFFGQTANPAERVINADPDAWYAATPEAMGQDNYADFRRATHEPATVHAMLEDYRAGLGVDRNADDADRRAGRQIACPTLFLWATKDDLQELYDDPVAIWRDWTTDLRAAPIESGHHMAEEAPAAVAGAIAGFLRAD